MLNIVCVNDGTKYSNEYVNILCDSITRNVDVSFKFVCFTNRPEGLDIDIEVRELPAELEGRGWFNKLYLFRDGLFPDGDRIVYFDLKNVIISDLDPVLAYKGKFAILRDFLRPDGWQSGLMAWEANTLGHIWDLYKWHKYPEILGGDQIWIENVFTNRNGLFVDNYSFPPESPAIKVDIWQDLFPDAFHSYKVSNCISGIPKNAKIVFFHGEPYPDQIKDGWVPHVWKVNGGTSLELMTQCNTPRENIVSNIREALSLKKQVIKEQSDENQLHAVIVGGAPSLSGFAEEIKMRQEHGQKVVALNNAWRFLDKNGIEANYHVMIDARKENAEFVPPAGYNVSKLYATQCHPDVTKEADLLWNCLILDIVPDFEDKDMFWIGAGTTVGIRTLYLMYAMGYREFHLYGFDSCYLDGSGHAYEQALNGGERIIDVEIHGRKFKAAPWMVTQVHDFLETAEMLTSKGCKFTIHGDGMLQHAAATMLLEKSLEGDMMKIGGVYWPATDVHCSYAMHKTIGDIDDILMFVPKKGTAVQAGGNVGLWPKKMAEKFGRVFTFEPDELNFKCLNLNCNEPNVIKANAALGEASGTIGMVQDMENCGAHQVHGEGKTNVVTIDGLKLDECDLIQLDIEGYEIFALRGASETIKKFHPVIVVEHKEQLMSEYGVKPTEIADFLSGFGYSLKRAIHRDLIYTAA